MPLLYSCDGRKEWEGEEEEEEEAGGGGVRKGRKRKSMCVKESEQRDGTGACSARIALLA